jgi:Ca-activated chloride channel family protein
VRRAALLGALALLPVPLLAQEPSPSPSPPARPPLRLEVDTTLVSVTAVVQDKAGRFISGLGTKDIEVREDGVRQDVSFFREARGAEHVPLTVALVLDSSGSMSRRMHFLQEAAVSLLHKLQPGDRALVVQFNESVKASSEFTGDVERLEQFVESLQAWGGTSLYDAVHYGLNRLRDEPGRKALVVFSDGADTTSSMREQEVVDYARAVEATVYSVGIRGEQGLFARGPRGFLRNVARETGGTFHFPDRVGELVRTFSGIAEELQHHYLLAYTPKRPPDGTWRAIDVKVKRDGAELRVRKGYFAVKRTRGPKAAPAGDGSSDR